MSASQLYDNAKLELEQLQREYAPASAWHHFANRVLEWMMACQTIASERQRSAVDRAKAGDDPAAVAALRTEAKDARYYAEQLTALYQRVRQHL